MIYLKPSPGYKNKNKNSIMIELDASTTIYPLIGGFILSAAVSFQLLMKGRLTGVSSIFTGIITWDKGSLRWKSAFVAGLIGIAALIFMFVGFDSTGPFVLDSPEVYVADLNLFAWVLAGFFVGIGTRLGNGCTSGHGLCGIPRLSKRSIIAVSCFMGVAIITATARYYLGILNSSVWVDLAGDMPVTLVSNIALGLAIFVMAANYHFNKDGKDGLIDMLVGFTTGALFAIGLILSGMTRRSYVLGFLTLNQYWNPAMMFVFAGGLTGNFITFKIILGKEKPLYGEKFEIPTRTDIDAKLVGGASMFGFGWGLGGLCPAPAMIGTIFYLPHVILFFITSLAAGQYTAGYIINLEKKNTTAQAALLSKA